MTDPTPEQSARAEAKLKGYTINSDGSIDTTGKPWFQPTININTDTGLLDAMELLRPLIVGPTCPGSVWKVHTPLANVTVTNTTARAAIKAAWNEYVRMEQGDDS